MENADNSIPKCMRFFEKPLTAEEARAQRTREASADFPEGLRQQVNEHRQRREEQREVLIEHLEEDFQDRIRSQKQEILAKGGPLEPKWATRVLGVVFAKKLEALAREQIRESDLSTLQKYDRKTRDHEMDMLQVYEMSLQRNRHDDVSREPRREQGRGMNKPRHPKDRGPDRTR